MAKTSVQKLIDQGDRLKSRVKRVEVDKKRAEGVALGTAGAAAAAFFDARFGEGEGDFEIAGIPVTLAAGGLMVAAGLSRKVPQSERVLELGKGVFYSQIGSFLRQKFEESGT